MELLQLVTLILGMAGLGAFFSALVNVGKSLGWIKDGQAPTYVTGFNLVAVIVIYALKVKGLEIPVDQVDDTFSQIAQVVVIIGQLVVQLGGSAAWHKLVKGFILIGKSYTVDANRMGEVPFSAR